METVHTQCPACFKPYVVDVHLVLSSNPQFECKQCNTRFNFDSAALKECPKCKAKNLTESLECANCGVIFAKFRSWKADGEYWQFYNRDLSQGWRDLLRDYENEKRHHEFLDKCWKAGKLELAARYYGRILEADPSDDLARAMVGKISQLAQMPLESKSNSPQTWRPGLISLVISLGALLVLIGYILPSARNLVGSGVALIVMAGGLRLYLRESY